MPEKLLKNTVAFWLNTTCLEAALAAARDMRACTHTVAIGPNLFLAHGPAGVRCLYELGISDVLLDMRFAGTPKEIWQCTTAAACLGVKAITVSAMAGQRNIRYAVEAAEASKTTTLKVKRPKVFVSPLPYCLDDRALVDELQLRVRRKQHVTQAAKLLQTAEADGIIVEYEDIRTVKKVSRKIPLLVYAQRRARNYAETDSEENKKKAGIQEILSAGASHVILDSDLLRRTNIEWAADMVNKELEAAREG